MKAEDLSEPMREKLALILADDVKVVSFDIFDTLLVRPAVHPSDVRGLVGRAAGVPHFPDKRRLAESHARERLDYPDEACTLAEVYAAYARLFGCPEEEAARLMQLELDAESSLLYARRSVQVLYREALGAGKEVVLTADTCLPEDFLEGVLAKNGYTGHSRTYLSCERRRRKGTGNLFGCLVSDLYEQGIGAGEAVHVGDDPKLDVEKAREAGLGAVRTRKALTALDQCPELKGWRTRAAASSDDRLLYGLFANMAFDDPYRPFAKASRFNGEARLLGYALAPFLVAFLLWAAREAGRDGVGRLLLPSRDGRLLQEVHGALAPWLPGPGIAAFRPPRPLGALHRARQAGGLYDFLADSPFDEGMGIADFAADRLFAGEGEALDKALGVFARRGYFSPDKPVGSLDDIAYFLGELEPYFKENVEASAGLCDEYVRGAVGPLEKVGLLDTGGRDGEGRALVGRYGLAGVRYRMFPEPGAGPDGRSSESTMQRPFITEAAHPVRDALFEDLLCEQPPGKAPRAGAGSGLTENDGAEEGRTLCLMQGGATEFAEAFAGLLGPYLHLMELDPGGLYGIVADTLKAPSRTDAQLIRRLSLSAAGIVQNRGLYTAWYKKNFPGQDPEKAPGQGTRPPLGKRLKKRARALAEGLHVDRQARAAYSQARKAYYSVARSKADRVLDGIRAQVDAGLEGLEQDTLIPRGGVLLVEGIHPAAYRAVSAISNAMPDYGWAYLTTRRIQDKLDFPVYPVPGPLERGAYPADLACRGAFVGQARADGRISPDALARIRKSYPRMGPGYAEFFACEAVRYYERAFECFAPRLVLVWNPSQAKSAIVDAVARGMGIPVAYFESGELPGTVAVDQGGLFGEGWPAREPDRFAALPATEADLEVARRAIAYCRDSGANRYAQKQGSGLGAAPAQGGRRRPTVFLAGDYDVENGVYPRTERSKALHSPMFGSSHEAMVHLAGLARRGGWDLVYKPHPLAVRYEPARRPGNVSYVERGDVNRLVDGADLTAGIATSVAYTALLRGKPALTLGYTTLRGKGCAYEAFTADAIGPAIEEALGRGLTEGREQAFVRHTARMLRHYLFDNQGARPVRYGRSAEDAAQYLRGIIEGREVRP
ncbi:MAG: hypothetical protein FWG23_01560 [Eggerthellaceae bacterium]|nr:hypothetical protein [Eggerthellaceae bacterium]